MKLNLGFIGIGNMGSALLKGIVKSKLFLPEQIYVFDPDRSKTDSIKTETGVNVLESNEDVVRKCDIIIVAVKPAAVKNVLEPCKRFFDSTKILVTIAVGLPISLYKAIIGMEAKIIRTMPNTPALVEKGMTLISCDSNVSTEDVEIISKLFECVGKVELLDEKLMNEVTALTGSSPAYVFMFIEAMADAAVLSGIPRALAYKLASQAVMGSASMVLETGRHPAELKDQVCSPGGTTIEAVSVLEKSGFRNAVIEAMNECVKKAREIGKTYGG